MPLGRMGQLEDIAAGILYLASDESSSVTGAELVIDGGMTAQWSTKLREQAAYPNEKTDGDHGGFYLY